MVRNVIPCKYTSKLSCFRLTISLSALNVIILYCQWLERERQLSSRPLTPRNFRSEFQEQKFVVFSDCRGRSRMQLQTLYGQWIHGKEWHQPTDSLFKVENPASEDTIVQVATATANDVDRAVKDAHEVFKSGVWSQAEPTFRFQVLMKAAALLRSRLGEFAKCTSSLLLQFLM